LIRQRIRPVGEAVIIKRKITENKKILLSTKSEKIIKGILMELRQISPQEIMFLDLVWLNYTNNK